MSPLADEITTLWGQITAATHRFLVLLAEFEETGGWSGVGILSCAHWLNVYCGIGIVAAREKVRVARALKDLPGIDAAFAEGRVSYSKVRAMTRVASPENEEILLNIAIHGTAAHVERAVRGYRRVERIEAAREAAEAHRHRYLDLIPDSDGSLLIRGRVPPEIGELLRRALDRAMVLDESAPGPEAADDSAESSQRDGDRVDPAAPESLEDDRPVAARRADALRIVAEQFLATEAGAMGSAQDRYQVVVHIDQASLSARPSPSSKCLSELENGSPLAAETVRRLACGSVLIGMIDDESGEPLSVGRKTRAIPPAIERALRARDRGCRFPGCTHRRFTEGHHIRHWAEGGETKLANLITLCHAHHHLLHEGEFQIERADDGAFRFLQPDGRPVFHSRYAERRFSGSAIEAMNLARGLDIGPDTVRTRWLGETMDLSMVMDAMLSSRPARL
jgi:hypothetical protein